MGGPGRAAKFLAAQHGRRLQKLTGDDPALPRRRCDRPGAGLRGAAPRSASARSGAVEKRHDHEGSRPAARQRRRQHGQVAWRFRPLHGRQRRRFRSVTRPRSSSSPMKPPETESNDGFHAGWTVARDGLHRPRGGRRAGDHVALLAGDQRRAAARPSGAGASSRAATSRRWRRWSRRPGGCARRSAWRSASSAARWPSVIGAGLREYARSADRPGTRPRRFEVAEVVNRAMERTKERELAGLRRGMPVLATVASSAPFVGLFGTVGGIITAFQKLADPDQGGRRHRHRVGRHRRGADHDRRRPGRRDRRGLVLQLLHRPPRRHDHRHRRDGVRAGRHDPARRRA